MVEEWPIFAGLYLFVVVPLLGYIYGRHGRWRGGAGWILLVGGQVFLAIGAGELFAWGGLFGFFISGCGILLIVSDIYTIYRSQRRG